MMKKKILIKLGGSSLHNLATLQELVALVRGLRASSHDVILVHGGGPAINAELTARGIEWKFINGQRQTTPEMITVIEEVLAGTVNRMVVNTLLASDLPAAGLSGAEGGTLFCTQAHAELMQVGEVQEVNTALIEQILSEEHAPTPVIAPIGIGAKGEKYNINADWAATKLAMRLQVEKLIFLTDQNGILDGEKNLVNQVTPAGIHKMIESGVISGGMYTKVMTMITALNAGIGQVRVLNATLASRLLTDENIGTLLADEDINANKDATAWNRKLT